MMVHFVRVLGHVQASNFNLVKAHATIHFPDNIWDYGAPNEYSAEPFESMHIQLLKIGYRGSNHRDAMPQVLNSYRRWRALRRRQGLDTDDEEDDARALPAGQETTLEKVGNALSDISTLDFLRLRSQILGADACSHM
jgi:hypothetical protein